MKKIVLFITLVAMTAIAITYTSCSNELNLVEQESAVVGSTRSVDISSVDYCGVPKVVRFLAGQHTDVGSVTVGNDADSLYVTYKTTGDWYMKKLHLYVGACDEVPKNKGGLIPGQFEKVDGQFGVQVSFMPYQTTHRIAIAKKDLPECFCVAAHAEVEKVVNGKVNSQTAWGEGENMGNNWSMMFDYCVQECTPPDEPPTEVCYKGETAWAAGELYIKGKGKNEQGGNWATYTPYVANTSIDIYAGQHYLVGKVTFSEVVDGKVIITITTENGAVLQYGSETVKIQGYTTAPIGINPAPGQFETYKGTETTVTVDATNEKGEAFNYYGIHLDVKRVIDCPVK